MSTKNYLSSPYEVSWPQISQDDSIYIKQRLIETLTEYDVKRPKVKWFRDKKLRQEERERWAIFSCFILNGIFIESYKSL